MWLDIQAVWNIQEYFAEVAERMQANRVRGWSQQIAALGFASPWELLFSILAIWLWVAMLNLMWSCLGVDVFPLLPSLNSPCKLVAFWIFRCHENDCCVQYLICVLPQQHSCVGHDKVLYILFQTSLCSSFCLSHIHLATLDLLKSGPLIFQCVPDVRFHLYYYRLRKKDNHFWHSQQLYSEYRQFLTYVWVT